MFQLNALQAVLAGLSLGGFQLRFGLGDIDFRRHPTGIAAPGQGQCLVIAIDRLIENHLLLIGPAQIKIIGGQFRLQA